MTTQSGLARTIRLWRRGNDPLTAPVVFETTEGSMGVSASLDRSAGKERVWFVENLGMIHRNIWMGDRSGPKTRVDVPTDCWAQAVGDWLAVKPRTACTTGGETYLPDTVIGISFSAFQVGDRSFTRLFEPKDRRALPGFFWCGGRLILSVLDDLQPGFEVHTPSEGRLSRDIVTGLPDLGTAHV
jgi:prolyl oligopeptidase